MPRKYVQLREAEEADMSFNPADRVCNNYVKLELINDSVPERTQEVSVAALLQFVDLKNKESTKMAPKTENC